MSDEIEDIGSNPSPRAGIAEVVAARLSRRAALRGLAGAGAAAALADQLIEDATLSAKLLSIHVERHNPALNLYQRLGFRLAEDKGVYLLLEWRPEETQVG
jgi:ribosomal protein S18 acetylase RimI-like enzyme